LSTIGAVLLLVAAPVSDVLGSFVTPHSATLLLGSLCLLFVAWAVEVGRSPLRVAIVGAALGALCSLTQPHAIVGVAIAGLAIAAVSMRRAGAGRWTDGWSARVPGSWVRSSRSSSTAHGRSSKMRARFPIPTE